MRTQVHALIILAASVTPACSSMPIETTAVSAEAVINGSTDYGDYSVGLELPCGCSATLIGRRTALTAAHCVTNGQSVQFCVGADPSWPSNCVGGTAHRYPNFSGSYCGSGSATDFDHDVAVLQLSEDVFARYGVIPSRISNSAPAENWSVKLVGYGCTVVSTSTGYGTRRLGFNSISEVETGEIEYDDGTGQGFGCSGDSGGALFNASDAYGDCELGVLSGWQDFLFDLDGTTSRIDTKYSWIQQVANDPSVYPCGHAVCGDGVCDSGETCATCKADCCCAACAGHSCGATGCAGPFGLPETCCTANSTCTVESCGTCWNATSCGTCRPTPAGVWCRMPNGSSGVCTGSGSCTTSPVCFAAGTPIRMGDGTDKAIESVRVGDQVLAYDVEAGRPVISRVLETYVRPSEGTVLINGHLRVTPDHEFYANGNWVRARDLNIGDSLLREIPPSGAMPMSTKPDAVQQLETLPGTQPVYNFDVDQYHNYFADGILAHNKC